MTTTVAAASDPMLNTTVLGRYRIVRRLAAGGMGAVYLGRTEGAEGFTRPVVIKRVLPTLMGDREIAQMFVREAQILSHLQHPSIVSVLDFGQQEDDAYVMVLEYMHGYQLAEWMRFLRRTGQPMPVDFALHIMIRVLDALHYAHTFQRSDGSQLKIIHRDVSPSNVLLSDSGLVKLLDFGIARVSGDETTFKTERPRVRGKMPYLALEIFKGLDPNERTDLYSAGVVLFEMLTGFNPFFGRETADIYFKILNNAVPSVHASREDAPEEIDAVLARALAKDAADRYESAADLANALRGLRSAPEEIIVQQLSDRLRSDFSGPMQKAIGIEPLSAREAAWRSAVPKAPRIAAFPRAHEGDIAAEPLESDAPDPAAITVQHSVQPQLLAAAGAASASDDDEVSLTPTAPPPPLEPDADLHSAPFASATGLTPPVAPSVSSGPAAPAAPSAALASTKRIALVVVLAAVVGSLSAAGLFLMMNADEGDEPVVVIERETRAPLPAPAPVVAPAPAPALAPQPAVEPAAAADAAAAEGDEPEVAAEAAAPLPPNPKRLTRQFGRRQKQIEACFAAHAQELQGQPQISVHFRIGERGQVIEAALSPEPLAGTALGRCLLGIARAASFGPQQTEFAFRIPITAQKIER